MEHNTKMLGGIAYIVLIVFSVLGALLPAAGLITLAAAICVVVAFVRAGNEVGRPDVKQSIITSLVLYIVGVVVMLIVAGSTLAAVLMGSGGDPAAAGLGALAAVGVGAIIGLLIAWALSIVAAWFWYKASTALAEETQIALFKTGGLLMFIGAITVIVFGLGGIVTLVGAVLQCVAFFSEGVKRPVGADAVV